SSRSILLIFFFFFSYDVSMPPTLTLFPYTTLFRSVMVEVLHVATIDVGGLDLGAGVEGLVDDLAGDDVLELGANERRPLAGLDVLELQHLPQLLSRLSTSPFFRSLVVATNPSFFASVMITDG